MSDTSKMGDSPRDVRNRQAQRKAGWWSDKAYMTQLGHESTLEQQEDMRSTADIEVAHQATRDERKAKTAKEYKGVK